MKGLSEVILSENVHFIIKVKVINLNDNIQWKYMQTVKYVYHKVQKLYWRLNSRESKKAGQ